MSPVHRNDGEISAVARSFQILKEFRSAQGTLTLQQLVDGTALAKTTVHRMVGELVRIGALVRRRPGFELGVLMFELGQAAPGRLGLLESARPVMADLNRTTGHNVGFVVLDGVEVVYLEVLSGRDAPRLPQRPGARWPAHASCSGKAILAWSSPEAQQRVIAVGLPGLTANTLVDPEVFTDELVRIRRRGVAIDRGESFDNVAAVAAPVFDSDGGVIGALSMSGLPGRINLSRLETAVRLAATAVTRALEHAQVHPSLRREIAAVRRSAPAVPGSAHPRPR